MTALRQRATPAQKRGKITQRATLRLWCDVWKNKKEAAALWGYGGNGCGKPDSWHAAYLLPDVVALQPLTLDAAS